MVKYSSQREKGRRWLRIRRRNRRTWRRRRISWKIRWIRYYWDNLKLIFIEDEAPKKKYLKFTEKDYTIRKPLPKYEMLKSIETMCISAGNA